METAAFFYPLAQRGMLMVMMTTTHGLKLILGINLFHKLCLQ